MNVDAPFDLTKPSPIGRLAQLLSGASEAVVRDRHPSDVRDLLLVARRVPVIPLAPPREIQRARTAKRIRREDFYQRDSRARSA